MTKYLLCLLLSITSLTVLKAQENQHLHLIPYPQELQQSEGYFSLSNTLLQYHLADKSWKNVESMITKSLFGTISAKKGNAKSSTLRIYLEPSLAREGYRLQINEQGINLTASSEAGALLGLQTLQQLYLLAADHSAITLPYVEISDEPAFKWRGIELDVARHFFSKEYIYKFIDLLARYKFNKFHFHLTDDQGWRIEIKKYPKLTEQGAWRIFNNQDSACLEKAAENPDFTLPHEHIRVKNGVKEYGGYYTQKDIKDIVAYATSRNVEIIPEIDMPGHMMVATTAYPELLLDGAAAGWGKQFSVPICPGKESSYTFVENVLMEVMALFPSKYIHIGADEVEKTSWEQSPLCEELMRKENLHSVHDLQSYFVQRVNQFIKANGKRTIGWDEILEGPSDSSMTVMYWRGWEKNAPAKAVSRNHELIMTPTNPLYFDYLPNSSSLASVYQMQVLHPDIPAEKVHLVQGVQANVWTEMIPTTARLEFMILPRLTALAERAWTNKPYFEGYQKRLLAHYTLWDDAGLRYRMPDLTGFTEEQVLLDGQAVLNVNNSLKRSAVHYTTDGSLPTLESSVLQDSLSVDKPTSIRFATFSPSGAKSELYRVNISAAEWQSAKPQPTEKLSKGLRVDFYPGVFASTGKIKGDVSGSEIINNVALADTLKTPAFGAKIRGFIQVPTKGIYGFFFTCDDGGVLRVADQLVVDNDGQHAPIMKSGQVALEAGLHPIAVDFIEAGGGFTLKLEYSIDGTKVIPIPDAWFKH